MLRILREWLKRPSNRPQEAEKPGEPAEYTYPQAFAVLDARMAEIERQWAEVLDKINRWASREAARRRKEASESLDSMTAEAPSGDPAAAAAAGGQWDKAQLRRLARQRFGGRQA